MVRLPAETCPSCATNLRTGEKPEEEVPFHKRRGFKTLVVIFCCLAPLFAWIVSTDQLNGEFIERMRLGLQSCADPPVRKMWETNDPAREKAVVRTGYASWTNQRKSRPAGQDATGPESPEAAAMSKEERAFRADRNNYFASSLFTSRPADTLSEEDNWYGTLVGEWDVAWLPEGNPAGPDVMNGEWNFMWINSGEAIQDILAIPYLWEKRKNPLRTSTVRTHNEEGDHWEGARVQNGRIFPFRASRNADGNIFESYQTEPGVFVVWTFNAVTPDSFRVYVNQTSDNGKTYRLVAEIWAKKRFVDMG
jgi:hypothetical protein